MIGGFFLIFFWSTIFFDNTHVCIYSTTFEHILHIDPDTERVCFIEKTIIYMYVFCLFVNFPKDHNSPDLKSSKKTKVTSYNSY